MPYQLEMFPPSFLYLQEQVLKDPVLLNSMILDLSPSSPLEEKLAYIASYLDILVDGMYDTDDLCHMMANKLAERNALILLPSYLTQDRK